MRRPVEPKQHACTSHQAVLAEAGIRPPMSRKGDPCDNAPTESFCKTLKAELVDGADCATHDGARRDLFAFVEVWHNRQRLRSAIGYTTPERMELAAA